MQQSALGGPAEVAINEMVIPANFLSEVSVELTEGTRQRTTLGGTFTRGSGVLETAQAMFTLYLPSMDYLKNIFPGRYNAPTAPQTTGNIIIGNDSCSVNVGGPVNIHFQCETNDDNDVYFYNAVARLNFNPTYSTDEDLTVEVTLDAQPDENGNIARLGTGDLTEESIYDPTTQTTVPVES